MVVELLNFVYEGKYSVSSSALSMISSFNCLFEMDTLSQKGVMERLIANVVSLGENHQGKQSCVQFNIWKQSMQQRENDEMIFTALIDIFILTFSIMITLEHNMSMER